MKSFIKKIGKKLLTVVFFTSLFGCKNVVTSEKLIPEKVAADYVNNLIYQNNIMTGRSADCVIPDFFNEIEVEDENGEIKEFSCFSEQKQLEIVKMWKEEYVRTIIEKIQDDNSTIKNIADLNSVVEKSLRKTERVAVEKQKDTFLTNYTKELGKLVKAEEKARNSSAGSSINTKEITEDCLIDSSFKKLLKNYEKGRMLHEDGAIGHVSLMHLTNKEANLLSNTATGWTKMTITSFAYHNTTTWPNQTNGVQYEPVGYWCGNSEGGAKKVHLIKAVGEYGKIAIVDGKLVFPWTRIKEKTSINEKAVKYAESKLGIPYIPKGEDWQIPYLDNFVKYKWSDDYSYCSQLAWRSFKSAGGKQYDFEENLSLPWISPNDIYLNHKTEQITSWTNEKK